ncbi:MAG: SdrD B-like domain-containing protein, partial [Planctomycetaceae bacterium]
MRPSFRQLWSLYARNLFRKARGHRRRQRPGQTARIATEVLETRQLLSSRVADVLKGSSDTRITGTVYEDVNSNCVKYGSVNGVQGLVVYLDLDGSGTWNTDDVGDQEPSALTNVDGDFIINKLVPGTYRIAEVVQAGWSPTAAVSKEVVVLNKKETKTNFYNFAGGAVEGTVWNDLDQDGERAVDPETGEFLEPGLAGWTLFVDINNSNDLDAGDPVTTTDTNGLYRFENLPPQDYEVYQVLPDLWEPSEGYDIHQTAGIQALQVTSLDFANFSDFNGGLEGTIWNDLNYNGVRDVDPVTGGWTDPGLESWTVFLDLDWDGAYTDGEPTALTDEDGHYVFNSVPAGGYLVTEVLPADWNVGEYYSSSWYVDVSAGSTTVVPDFSNFTSLYGTITGTIWNDRFRDGARDVDVTGAYLDPGLVGWTVFLDLNHNLAFDAGEPNTTTDTNGVYTFPDLQVGDYEVFEVIPTGWETTLGYDFSQTVTVWSGAVSVASDFANYNLSATLPGTVSGIAWSDLNANGVRDTDGTGAFTDPGITGRTVFIDLNSNGILDTTDRSATTASDGTYTFSNVNPGTLTIIEVIPAGWSATNPSTAARTVVLRNAGAPAWVDFGTY